MKRWPQSFYLLLLPLLVLSQGVFVAAYIGHEHTIYFWDHAMYLGFAQNLFEAARRGGSEGWATFAASLHTNYNFVFALPDLLSFELFGISRQTFILTNFVVFFVLFEIALACFLRRILGLPLKTALPLSLIFCSWMPPLWLPLLEGYPDIGAAAFITFAAAVGGPSSKVRKNVLKGMALGVSLAFAILLRRHFIYPALALVLSYASLTVIDFKQRSSLFLVLAKQALLFYLPLGLSLAAVLLLVEPSFIVEALTTNYNSLYLSYHKPPLVFVRFLLGGFGLGLLFLASLGYYFLWRLRVKSQALLVLLFSAYWLLLWTMGPDQTGHHYMLHALPLFVATGLTGCYLTIAQQKRAMRLFLSATLAFLLTANSVWSLWLSAEGVLPNDNGTPSLLSAPRPPVVRKDVEEWQRLADYLQAMTTSTDRIMIIGSSFIFNADILHSLYAAGDDGQKAMLLRLAKSPEIDHEEGAPLDLFASASVYVVAKPTQYHLDKEGQKIVTAAANQFPPQDGREDFFAKDPKTFSLDNGVTVEIWRKSQLTPMALHELFQSIRRDARADALFNQDWVALKLPLQVNIMSDALHETRLDALFIPSLTSLKLILDEPLAEGDQRLGLSIESNCRDTQFRLSLVTGNGKLVSSRSFSPVIVPGQVFAAFSVPKEIDQPIFAELQVNAETATLCQTDIRNLRLERQ